MHTGPSRPNTGQSNGFTLVELAVALGLFVLLAAAIVPSVLNYRVRSSINESASLTQALIQQGAEAAKTAGSPLADELRLNGLASGQNQASPGVQIVIRLRKRLTDGEAAQTLLERVVAKSSSVVTEFEGLGVLDIDTETNHLGVFVEVVERRDTAPDVVLVTLPIDVNGEFVLATTARDARIRFAHNNYSKEVRLTLRGTVTLDRR